MTAIFNWAIRPGDDNVEPLLVITGEDGDGEVVGVSVDIIEVTATGVVATDRLRGIKYQLA